MWIGSNDTIVLNHVYNGAALVNNLVPCILLYRPRVWNYLVIMLAVYVD